jgi:hypothetical protein
MKINGGIPHDISHSPGENLQFALRARFSSFSEISRKVIDRSRARDENKPGNPL